MRRGLSRPLVAALVLSAALAGCTAPAGEEVAAPAGGVDRDVQLAQGRGAIAGLLLDDRLRPIPAGLVLLVEVGRTARTDGNGEFAFVDLAPGRYTLRASADGHEARPEEIEVVPGQFAEANIVARRVANVGGTVLTREHSLFIACSVGFVANGINAPCTLDEEEGYSSFFLTNLTEIENVTYVVTEMKANQQMRYTLQIRVPGVERYIAARFEGDYVRTVMKLGERNTEHEDVVSYGENVPWNNTREFQTIFFIDHPHRREIQDNWPANPGAPVWPGPPCCGLGYAAGVRASIVQSVFVGEPEVDIETYRVYG